MKKIEKIERLSSDPYTGDVSGSGDSWMTPDRQLYAPAGDIKNKLDVLRLKINEIIEVLNKSKHK